MVHAKHPEITREVHRDTLAEYMCEIAEQGTRGIRECAAINAGCTAGGTDALTLRRALSLTQQPARQLTGHSGHQTQRDR